MDSRWLQVVSSGRPLPQRHPGPVFVSHLKAVVKAVVGQLPNSPVSFLLPPFLLLQSTFLVWTQHRKTVNGRTSAQSLGS